MKVFFTKGIFIVISYVYHCGVVGLRVWVALFSDAHVYVGGI